MPAPCNDQKSVTVRGMRRHFPRTCLEDLRRTSAMAAGVKQVSLSSVEPFRSCKRGHTVRKSTRLQPDWFRRNFNDGDFYENLSKNSKSACDRAHTQPPPQFNGYQVSFSGVKRPERRADHPPPFTAEVRGTAELTLWAFMECRRVDFTF